MFEFAPLILFLAAFLWKDIFFALIVLMVAAPLLGVLHQQVSGTWVLAVDLDIGQGGEATFVLSQEGDEISGTYSGALGQDVPVTGKVTEDGVEFSFDSQAGTVNYK